MSRLSGGFTARNLTKAVQHCTQAVRHGRKLSARPRR
jgi:hypothetical protein